MHLSTELLVWGIVAHLVADWMFQNDWMAVNKVDLSHPAAWTHAGIHALFLWLIFPWSIALLIGFTHFLIDSRKPVAWWMRIVKQTRHGPHKTIVEMALDQVFHIAVLALVVLFLY